MPSQKGKRQTIGFNFLGFATLVRFLLAFEAVRARGRFEGIDASTDAEGRYHGGIPYISSARSGQGGIWRDGRFTCALIDEMRYCTSVPDGQTVQLTVYEYNVTVHQYVWIMCRVLVRIRCM